MAAIEHSPSPRRRALIRRSTREVARDLARGRARPLVGVLFATAVLASWRSPEPIEVGSTPDAAVARVLTSRGLACESADLIWIDGPRRAWMATTASARVLVRASARGEPTDLYVVDVNLSPEGALVGVGRARDITETSGVDESRPLLRGRLAVYSAAADGLVTGVHVLDLAGRAPESYPDLTRVQRTQVALTNLQQTGQTAGFGHVMFALDPVARRAALAWRDDGTIEVQADEHVVVLDPVHSRVVSGESLVRVVPDERARPGNVATWAVDRARALPWFGDDRMQWIKAVAFTVLDKLHATFAGATTSEDVRNEIGLPAGGAAPTPTFTDPEIGWPPAPIPPVVSPPLPGEGQWIALDRDPFITRSASGAAAAFVTSFLRPNAARQDVRVYVTLWDPRQIALHMEAGTVEPISATGERGPGLIPRTPEVMRHVVAAFNGGFQAQHGEYGMQANGIEYLPPKPYAASVVELRDGSNAFGAWPADLPAVPDDIIALRQNLTALVQDGKFNPWGRNWWGGTPPGWPDQVHSTRSAICMTKGGFAGYFYSTSISAEDLGHGMLAAGCSFGIHLDMNPGHAGFEFYDVAPGEEMAPLGRRLQPDWEAEGKVPDMPGYVFRSRRMIRAMGHMLFPRYIQREARDFFYLTSRTILPGAPVPNEGSERGPDEGLWQTKGLPQHGFPYALATSWVRAAPGRPDLKLSVVRADPRTMGPADRAPEGAPVVLALAAPVRGSLTLWWSHDVFTIAPSHLGAPPEDAVPLVEGHPLNDPGATLARAAVGVQDEDGMLVWVELPSAATPDAASAAAMDRVLERLGCSTRFGMVGDARALLGGTLDAAGRPLANPPPVVARLARVHAPDAHPIFADTPIVPIQVWQPLQAKRVRYFIKPTPAPTLGTVPSAGSSAAGPPGGARRAADLLAHDPGGR